MNRRLGFGINHYLCAPEMSLPAFLDVVASAGFDGVGLTQRALDEMPLAALSRELSARDLRVTSINSAGFLLGATSDVQRERNRRLVEATAELDAGVLNVLPGHDIDLPKTEAQAIILEGFVELSDIGKDAGIRLAIEPLHARHARIRSCVNTIADTSRLVQASPSASLNFDMYHLWEDRDLDATVEGTGPKLGLVQICDIEDLKTNARRAPLDEGEAEWRPFVQRVRDRHPQVPIELELFADQLPGRSAAAIVGATARLLRK